MLRQERLLYHRFTDQDLTNFLASLRVSMILKGCSEEFIDVALKDKKQKELVKMRNHNQAHKRFDRKKDTKNRDRVAVTNALLDSDLSKEHRE